MSVDTSNRNLARLQHDLKHSLSNEVFAEARAVIHALQAERDAAVEALDQVLHYIDPYVLRNVAPELVERIDAMLKARGEK